MANQDDVDISDVFDKEKAIPTNNGALKGRDNAIYVRQQKGHSLLLHIILLFFGVGLFTIPYICLSKNHYWHA